MGAKDKEKTAGERPITDNRKARHDYAILEVYETGMVLHGTEVKSLRDGRANLKDAYAQVQDGEVWLLGCHISPYSHRGYADHNPERPRKLLLHRSQINRLMGKVQEKGLTLIPLRLYFKEGRAKAELALAKGKKLHDKRVSIREREARRELEREVRARVKY